MELKVHVEGIERCVSGVSEETTCAQIIYALAHASAQKGRFVLIERFRNIENKLNPNDRPLEVLKKWRENAANVTFILRRIEESDANSTLSNRIDDLSKPSLLKLRDGSSFSYLPYYNTRPLPDAFNGNTLPRQQQRPPPPDYKTVMEQKYNSLSRDVTRTRIVKKEPENSYQGLTKSELMSLIEKQNATLASQKESLVSMELEQLTISARELLQLEKQHENLRLILEPLKKYNWPQQYQLEVKKSHKLKAAIEATKEHIDKTKSDLKAVCDEEKELLKKIDEEQNLLENNDQRLPENNLNDVNISLRAF